MMTPLNHKQRVSTALSHEIHAFFSCLMSLNKRSWGHQYQSVNLTIKTKILTPDLHLEKIEVSIMTPFLWGYVDKRTSLHQLLSFCMEDKVLISSHSRLCGWMTQSCRCSIFNFKHNNWSAFSLICL